MRFLAIDLGDKRTGLAVGDAITRTATPLDVIEIPINRLDGRALLGAIASAAADHLMPRPTSEARDEGRNNVFEPGSADEDFARRGGVVLGLPINMDGTEGPRAALLRVWGNRIAEATGHCVLLVDERLSSAQADQWMARSGLTRKQKKERRDALAATAILQRYLDGLSRTS